MRQQYWMGVMQKMMNIQIALTEMCIYLDTSWIIAVHICPNTLRSNHQCQANEPFSRAHDPAYIFYLGWIPRKSNQNGIIHEYNAFVPPPPSLWNISSMQTSDTHSSLWSASQPPRFLIPVYLDPHLTLHGYLFTYYWFVVYTWHRSRHQKAVNT